MQRMSPGTQTERIADAVSTFERTTIESAATIREGLHERLVVAGMAGMVEIGPFDRAHERDPHVHAPGEGDGDGYGVVGLLGR